MIYVYNTKNEDYTSHPNNYYIGRSKNPKTKENDNPLANPFTHNGVKSSLAKLSFKTREEAVKAYEEYFDKVYGTEEGEELTKAFDEIYEHYKNGEDIYLQCFCHPRKCHGDIIAEKLQSKLIKEKLKEMKENEQSNQ